jgi:SPP1 gp7 family putative phage head morphogenesis protein
MAARSRVEATARLKALAFLESVRVDVRSRKTQDRVALLAAKQYDLAADVARIALANKASAVLRRVGVALRDGRLTADLKDREALQRIVGEGLTDARADLMLTNAVRTAYHAGRYEQQRRDPTRQYLIYRTMGDDRVRPGHARLDGTMLAKSDKFWNEHYPPNGHNCRCRVDGLTQVQYDELKGKAGVRTKAPKEKRVRVRDKLTGRASWQPETVDSGWAVLPNDPQRQSLLVERAIARVQSWEPPLASSAS